MKTTAFHNRKKTAIIVSVIALALLVVAVIVFVYVSKSQKYSAALDAENAGNYQEAYRLYNILGGYKDSPQKKQTLEEAIPTLRFSLAQENDVVTFGSFEQDGNTENGAEDLEWVVLDRRNDRVLLLSKYVLACMPYNNENAYLTWEEFSLRDWLNNEFISTAFTDSDRQLLADVQNKNNGNNKFETDGGNDTLDTVFLLSTEEASAYFHEEDARLMNGMGEPTQVAISQGISITEEEGAETVYSPWWLRGPGVYQNSAAFVETDGTVYENGAILDNANFCGVRPAIWAKAQ